MIQILIAGIFLLLIPISAAAAETPKTPIKRDVLVYFVPVSYHGSVVKEHADVQGVYVYYGKGSDYSVEAEYDSAKIKYVSDYVFKQKDSVFVYTRYEEDGKIRFGAHTAKTSTVTDSAETFFLGSAKYNPDGYDFQIDAFLTSYKRYSPSLEVYQATPAFGRFNKKRNVYYQTKAYLINTSRKLGTNSKTFKSVEETVTYHDKNLTVILGGWAGKQMYAIRNDGFILYNTPETHKGGYNLSLAWSLENGIKLTLQGGVEKFRDFGADNRATSTQTGVSLTRTF